MSKEQHTRTKLLLGKEKFNRLQKSHVLVVGLGGVGGYAVEQLVRAGVGKLTIIDADCVNESNLNRQIIALNSTIGKDKVEVISERIEDINPEIEINTFKIFISEENIESVLRKQSPDYVIDAIDTLMPKVELIKNCLKQNIPIVSSMGAGGRFDVEKIHIANIEDTYNCGLARMLRKRLHKIGIRTGFKAVFSSEKVDKKSIIKEESRNKITNLGTISYMPAMFGLLCASVVLSDLHSLELSEKS